VFDLVQNLFDHYYYAAGTLGPQQCPLPRRLVGRFGAASNAYQQSLDSAEARSADALSKFRLRIARIWGDYWRLDATATGWSRANPEEHVLDRMTTLKTKVVIVVSTALISMASASAAAFAADECLASPNGSSPQGQHWRYHLDRQTQRKCWYLATVGREVTHQAAGKPSVARTEESGPAHAARTESRNEQAAAPEQPLADAPAAAAGTVALVWPDPPSGAGQHPPAPEPGPGSGQAAAAAGGAPSSLPLAYTASVSAAQQADELAAPVSGAPAALVAVAAPLGASGAYPVVVLAGVLAVAIGIGLGLSRWLARRRDTLHHDLGSNANRRSLATGTRCGAARLMIGSETM
jgi:hypothetical protein